MPHRSVFLLLVRPVYGVQGQNVVEWAGKVRGVGGGYRRTVNGAVASEIDWVAVATHRNGLYLAGGGVQADCLVADPR